MNRKKITRVSAMVLVLILSFTMSAFAATATVTASALNVRTGPSTSYDRISLLYRGNEVEVLGDEEDGFYQIRSGSLEGYVSGDYLSFGDNDSSSNSSSDSTGIVTAGCLNVRQSPVYGGVFTHLYRGNQVTILSRDSSTGWYEVQVSGKSGWCSPDYITTGSTPVVSSSSSSSGSGEDGTVTASCLNVRESPVDGSVLTHVYRGDKVTIVSTASNGWYEIKIAGGTGWCSPDYITKGEVDTSSDSSSSLRDQIVEEAMKYLGVPYVYAGCSPSGFDCSGLVKYVYAQFGYDLYHGSTTQYRNATPISKDELQKGDLVFFTTSGGIDHVGIYIGNNQYIHAQSYGNPVNIKSLSESWSAEHYYGAATVLD